jgi:flagellar M-ring protein FliF
MAEAPGQPRQPVTALTVQQRAGALMGEAMIRVRGMDSARRSRWLMTAAVVVACFAGMLWYASRPDWRTLYAGLDSEDARQMAQQLTTAGIPFDVSPDGATLRVPAANLDKARLATTAKGAPKSGRMGFELFDQPNWMGSEFDEKVNYQRALEGELERTIGTLAEVQSARVHLVLPHDSLFTADQREAKASVVLRLRHRTLADEEAEGIKNLVAGAVDQLRPENVELVDAEGGALLGRRSGDAALEAREQELAEKVVETLEPAAGVGNVRASVNIAYDANSADELDETYDPAQTATLAMQRNAQTNGQAAGAWGVPGTTSNGGATVPAGSGAGAKPPLYPPTGSTAQSLQQESATYGVSKKTRHMVEAAGQVDRVTAAVLINFARVGGSPQSGKQEVWKPRSAAEMKQLSDLAAAAIGIDAGRGDQVSIEELAFDDNGAPPAPTLATRVVTIAGQSQGLLRYGTILVAMLAFFFFVARPALRALAGPMGRTGATPAAAGQRGAGQTAVGQVQAGAARELSSEQIAAEQKKAHAQNVFEQVSETVKKEPAQSSRLIESWIRAD